MQKQVNMTEEINAVNPTAAAEEHESQHSSVTLPDPATSPTAHPNILRMKTAFLQVSENAEFYTSDNRVTKFLESCKLPDPTMKLWNSSVTHARKELNDKAMELARESKASVVMPTDQQITALAIDKFKETWKKSGKGKPMPALPLVS